MHCTGSAKRPFDEGLIRNGQLTDREIDFANDLLRRQYPHVGGLESPLLAVLPTRFSIPVIQANCADTAPTGSLGNVVQRSQRCDR
jgi:hypothetical protein